jgi:hypothetical protein
VPTVDFTLDELTTKLQPMIQTIVDTSIDARFQIFEEKYEADMQAIQQDFLAAFGRLDRVENELAEVKQEVKRTNRLAGQHSRDIMELRATHST